MSNFDLVLKLMAILTTLMTSPIVAVLLQGTSEEKSLA
jgi:hypothetical protein